jgi:hypothetical protein
LIQNETDWIEKDSDSEADSLHYEWGEGDSDISGGDHGFDLHDEYDSFNSDCDYEYFGYGDKYDVDDGF